MKKYHIVNERTGVPISNIDGPLTYSDKERAEERAELFTQGNEKNFVVEEVEP